MAWGRRTDGSRVARLALMPLAIAAMAAIAAPASANHSYPATYTGSAASGGPVEFDVSADGTSVTRFAVKNVSTSCGTIENAETTGSIPISNHAFSQTNGPLRFSGTFPAVQQAQGTLSVQYFGYPSCTSDPVNWTASTTAPPPSGGANPAGTGSPGSTAYSRCVRKANRAFKKARKTALRAKRAADTKQQKRKARQQVKRAIKTRRNAIRKCASLR